MNRISFQTANYVARQTSYAMDAGWMQGDRETQEHFRPLDTFAERSEEILRDVVDLGFGAIDLWSAHLSGTWATGQRIAITRELAESWRAGGAWADVEATVSLP